jgi:hypothetical protein
VNIVHDQQKKASDDGPADALARTIEALERISAKLADPTPARLATITGDITLIRLLSAGRAIRMERRGR